MRKTKKNKNLQHIEDYSLITETLPYFVTNEVETGHHQINNILSSSTKHIWKALKKSGLPSDFARDLNTQFIHKSL